ncbi:MAG: 3'-5' exonuclease, partial [Cyanobacteria bacterium P01_F01_bin.42]
AINSSFTPAEPRYFRQFCTQQRLGRCATMVYAGRSTAKILDTANAFLLWANQTAGPVFIPQMIQPVPADDPQVNSNPAPLGQGVEVAFPADVYQSVDTIAKRIIQLYREDPTLSFAILVRENKQGQFLAEVLANPQSYELDFNFSELEMTIYDVGQAQQMSSIPRQMLTLLQFVQRPHSPTFVKEVLALLIKRQVIAPLETGGLVSEPERFLYPGPLDPAQSSEVCQARLLCTQMLRAKTELPQLQLMAFLAIALNYSAEELATTDKLASRIMQQTQGDRTLSAIIAALQTLLSSERFEPVNVDPDAQNLCRERQITILTMHKAKGLDWDVVFLPFLHESVFSGRVGVSQQMRFLGDISLPEASRHLIRGWAQKKRLSLDQAWSTAKALKRAEEHRLLYVAMTRPKRLLWMSACESAPFWWGGFSWDKPESLQSQTPVPFLTERFRAALDADGQGLS